MLDIKVLASGSSGNCYLIASGQEKLLLECGISFKHIILGLGFDLQGLQGCLVTHEHKDHSKAIMDILKHGIDVYCSIGTAESCGADKHYRTHFLQHKEPIMIGSFKVLPLKAEHDAKEPLMFVIMVGSEALLFATDTCYIPYRLPGITHVMLECNYDMDIINDNVAIGSIDKGRRARTLFAHMNLDTAKNVFVANNWTNLKRIILIHLSNANSDELKFIAEIEKITGVPVEVA